MRRNRGVTGAAALGLAVLLGGCTWLGETGNGVTNLIADTGARVGAPWGTSRPAVPDGSDTMNRVHGAVPQPTLHPEPGDVWPVQEAPRATLANPDAALRGIPAYRPGELDRPSAPAPRSTWQPTDPPPVRPLPPGLGGSSSLPVPLDVPQPAPVRQVVPPPLPPSAPPSPRADGQVIQTPGGPVTTTGGSDRVQGFVAPDGSTGVLHRDGNTATVFGPGGGVTTVPVTR